jgi:hypothetical protein
MIQPVSIRRRNIILPACLDISTYRFVSPVPYQKFRPRSLLTRYAIRTTLAQGEEYPLNRAGWRSGKSLGTHSGVARFEFRPEHRRSWMRFFVIFPAFPGKFRDSTYIRPRPLPSRSFPIHISSCNSVLSNAVTDSKTEVSCQHSRSTTRKSYHMQLK